MKQQYIHENSAFFDKIIDDFHILLITATDIEKEILHDNLRPLKNKGGIIKIAKELQTYYFGIFGAFKAIHVTCGTQGTSGRESSLATTIEAINDCKPKLVLIVGIAFGIDRKKQNIGDVLISESVINYEAQRVSSMETIPRASDGTAGLMLLNRFRNTENWEYSLERGKAEKICGKILSGEKLIDNIGFRNDLKNYHQTAIGGEMEGAGVYVACNRNNIEWILIKGICDFADGKKNKNKDNNQKIAAHAAVNLCVKVFNEKYSFEDIGVYSYDLEIKSMVYPTDKLDFIGDYDGSKFYLKRKYTELQSIHEATSMQGEIEQVTLGDIVNNCDKVFILGNPGIGKSTEFKHIAHLSWKEGEIDEFVPIYKNLKNFTNIDNLETYLPNRWKEIKNIVLLLDGIDEIANIEDFKSKLESFIEKYKNSTQKIKYIISCRTNVFNSLVNNINNFKKYSLNELPYEEGILLLKNKCQVPINPSNFKDTAANFLKNPFKIEILASYINEKNDLPKNTLELWKAYIDKRLTIDKKDKLNKININVQLIKNVSEKVSIVNELMKTNIFLVDDLDRIVDDDQVILKEFLKSPLIDCYPNEEKWFFEHRNIQEYFASKAISKLSLSNIKEIVTIKGTNKTHPLLFNTIINLINILSGEKYKEFTDWLFTVQPELLFNAEIDRIKSFRIQVFQNYFNSECINKTYWIATNRTYSVQEIATFGDCDENFEYLMVFVENAINYQFRVPISAIELLSYFSLKEGNQKDILKISLIKLLKQTDIELTIKAYALRCIRRQNFHQDDNYIDEIFCIFEKETSNEVNISLLDLINSKNDEADKRIAYIEEEFRRVHKIDERKVPDEVYRGNESALRRILLKFRKSDNYIKIISYYFYTDKYIKLDEEHAQDILKRCDIFKDETDFVLRLFRSINGKTNYHHHDKLLRKIAVINNNEFEIAKYLIDNNEFTVVGYFVAYIVNREIIHYIASNFLANKIGKQIDADGYRNVLANYKDIEAAQQFNDEMLAGGFKFKTELDNSGLYEAERRKHQLKAKTNFDILFKKRELLDEIKKLFDAENGTVDRTKIREIENKWYEKNGYSSSIDTSIRILNYILDNYKWNVTYEMVQEYLENDFVLMKEIQTFLENDKVETNPQQQKKIKVWHDRTAAQIDFKKIIILNEDNSFYRDIHFELLKTVLFFHEKFNFDLSQEFLLKCIEFSGLIDEHYDEDMRLILKKINNKVLFDMQIVENINAKRLFSMSLMRHVIYAIENNLEGSYPKIGEYLKNGNLNHLSDRHLDKYIKATDNYQLLVECCKEVNSFLCWSAIRILMKNDKEKSFCKKIAIEYLELDLKDDIYHLSDALGVLFKLNSKEAIKYYLDKVDLDKYLSLNDINFLNYDAIEDYNVIEEMFFKIYNKNSDEFEYRNSASLFTAYVSNLSKTEIGYNNTKNELCKIKIKLEGTQNLSKDSGLFYINLQLDNSINSYVNAKSVALDIDEALKKVEEILG